MKHNNQHTTKKSYAKPVIEEVALDYEMSLVMSSIPDTPPEEPKNIAPKSSTPFNSEDSAERAFGGSEPNY